ncbi:transmembrane protein 53 [Xenopus tropicalis]|uniref:LOC100135126 protein n=1 Tax=Xenopus tropicalis TaxID=8364 RepID=A9JSB6_XENTR|nr:transmembrane protein 53 [Xenopus tropicalis]AAI55993.1 LOC100135126 protein [Xenopus tropicalis]|eukprot:NP_001107322.1 transmembrane protein 53 [Xenopus tropicalis]
MKGNKADSELDYTIEFPEPTFQDWQWDREQEPVVILLGWGGCKDQYLTKYGAIYHNKGCTVIKYTAAWNAVFVTESLGLSSLREEAKKLLELLFEYEIEKSPILFHVFSNGGFMLYRYIVELLQSHCRLNKLHVVGTIFDSAPGNRNVIGSVRALDTILRTSTNKAFRFLALAAFALMVIILRILLYPVTRYVHENHYDAMKKDPSRWPQLYLYSRADPIISYLDVESIIAARRRRCLPTEALDFGKSEHVSHFRRFPQRYSETCTSFLRDCVRKAAISMLSSEHPISY